MVIIIIQKREGERRLDSFVATLIVSLRRPLAPLLLLLLPLHTIRRRGFVLLSPVLLLVLLCLKLVGLQPSQHVG